MLNSFLPSKDRLDAFFKEHYVLKPRLSPKEKINAMLRQAVWSGKINKPKACSKCGETTQRICGHHHNGYSKKHTLDVVWLCDSCHHNVHYGYVYTS
jgi:hypothetical protein